MAYINHEKDLEIFLENAPEHWENTICSFPGIFHISEKYFQSLFIAEASEIWFPHCACAMETRVLLNSTQPHPHPHPPPPPPQKKKKKKRKKRKKEKQLMGFSGLNHQSQLFNLPINVKMLTIVAEQTDLSPTSDHGDGLSRDGAKIFQFQIK